MEAIPVVVRERIITLYGRGKSTEQIAEALGYCQAAVRRVRQHLRERGTLTPRTHACGRKGLLTPARETLLRELVAQKPDRTLAELVAALREHPGLGLAVAVSTMGNWVNALGLALKKKSSTPPSRTGRTSPRPGRPGTRASRALT